MHACAVHSPCAYTTLNLKPLVVTYILIDHPYKSSHIITQTLVLILGLSQGELLVWVTVIHFPFGPTGLAT